MTKNYSIRIVHSRSLYAISMSCIPTVPTRPNFFVGLIAPGKFDVPKLSRHATLNIILLRTEYFSISSLILTLEWIALFFRYIYKFLQHQRRGYWNDSRTFGSRYRFIAPCKKRKKNKMYFYKRNLQLPKNSVIIVI